MRRSVLLSVVLLTSSVIAGCTTLRSTDARSSTAWSPPTVRERAGDLTVRVWVCRVPRASTAPEYGGLPVRRAIDAAAVVDAVAGGVSTYFHTVSHGRLRMTFAAGGEVAMSVDEGPRQCVERARTNTPDAELVLAVADAEHAADEPGGFGEPGNAYIGANDLASLPSPPPLDLVEHELGHAIGWVHSGYDPVAPVEERYASALDVMSDSAAPRAVDPDRRDGADTLAIDRLLVGWIAVDEVVVADDGSTRVRLVTSTGPAVPGATRLLVVPLDGDRFATVESLSPSGYDDHLPEAGVAVHVVTLADGVVTDVRPVHSAPPYTDLLSDGDLLDVAGRTLRIGTTVDGAVTVVVDAG